MIMGGGSLNQQTLDVVYGSLLQALGKAAFRAGIGADETEVCQNLCHSLDAAWKSAAEAAQYAHAATLMQAQSGENQAAIIALALSASAVSSYGEIERKGNGDDFSQPLYSVFTHLNGEHPNLALPFCRMDGALNLPGAPVPVSKEDYAALSNDIRSRLNGLTFDERSIDAFLALLEWSTANVPATIRKGEQADISLFDCAKMTAAVGACLSEYLLDRGITDAAALLQQKNFRNERAFMLYSADLSGIQKFIYTVATKGAQKSLRSRSFFLELMMEHYVDDVLSACGLSRVNLIYSGGGHCYLLLPNTQAVADAVADINARTNNALIDWFGTSLFVAHGMAACSMNDLTNTPAMNAPYKEIFRRVSSSISRHKLSRYSAAQIRRLNRPQNGLDGRECTVCGSTNMLRNDRCPWCARFEALSARLQSKNLTAYVVSDNPDGEYDLPLPCGTYLTLMSISDANNALKTGHVQHIYLKNRTCSDLPCSTRLDLCDYYASNENAALAENSTGIRRLAICRMDVDNLGHAFVAGFEKKAGKSMADQFRYVTLSRTASLSRQLSHFFKRCMSEVLENGEKLDVSVVYSGGDDVFFIGAWDHVIQAAQRIQEQFTAFTGGALTISGGIGLYYDSYPIRLAADETAELESQAKNQPGKNAVTLFEPADRHTYSWSAFKTQVMGEKFVKLDQFFAHQDERGMAFLYRMTDLLRQAESDKLNLARYAYLLARLQPKKGSDSYNIYDDFSKQMYAWACNKQDRGQLITAIYLYVYMNRKAE